MTTDEQLAFYSKKLNFESNSYKIFIICACANRVLLVFISEFRCTVLEISYKDFVILVHL